MSKVAENFGLMVYSVIGGSTESAKEHVCNEVREAMKETNSSIDEFKKMFINHIANYEYVRKWPVYDIRNEHQQVAVLLVAWKAL